MANYVEYIASLWESDKDNVVSRSVCAAAAEVGWRQVLSMSDKVGVGKVTFDSGIIVENVKVTVLISTRPPSRLPDHFEVGLTQIAA